MAAKKGAFQLWVDRYGGVTELARDLGMSRVGVDNWYCRRGWPKVHRILSLIRLSGGVLTFESIIESTQTPEQKRLLANAEKRERAARSRLGSALDKAKIKGPGKK